MGAIAIKCMVGSRFVNQIISAGTYAMEIRSADAVTIGNTTATDLGHGGILNCRTDFAITKAVVTVARLLKHQSAPTLIQH